MVVQPIAEAAGRLSTREEKARTLREAREATRGQRGALAGHLAHFARVTPPPTTWLTSHSGLSVPKLGSLFVGVDLADVASNLIGNSADSTVVAADVSVSLTACVLWHSVAY